MGMNPMTGGMVLNVLFYNRGSVTGFSSSFETSAKSILSFLFVCGLKMFLSNKVKCVVVI